MNRIGEVVSYIRQSDSLLIVGDSIVSTFNTAIPRITNWVEETNPSINNKDHDQNFLIQRLFYGAYGLQCPPTNSLYTNVNTNISGCVTGYDNTSYSVYNCQSKLSYTISAKYKY